jgi:predicted small secreted protein
MPAAAAVYHAAMKNYTLARRISLVVSVTLLAGLLAACNTVKGAGTDLTEASDNTKKAISK